MLDELYGGDTTADANDKFLKKFILNKGWIDNDDSYVPRYREVVGGGSDSEGDEVDDESDEKFLEQMDQFEAAYNFRFG